MRKLVLALVAFATIVSPIALATAPADAASVKHPHHKKHHAKKHHHAEKHHAKKAKTKGTPTCMTKSEWYRIKVGMTRAEIKRITGVYGTVSYTTLDANGWEKDVTIDYPQCLSNGKKSPYSTVYTSWVNYEYGDEYNDWQDFYVPLHMDYKGSWSTPWA